jgi:hypothetical protein
VVVVYNFIVYPVCLWFVYRVVARAYTTWRALEGSRPLDDAQILALRRTILTWPLAAVGLSCAGWLPGGILFPLALQGSGSKIYVHFFVSFLLSWLITSTYTYFAVEYVVLRVLYPRLWTEAHGVRSRMREELDSRRFYFRSFQFLAGVIPLAGAALLIAWVEELQDWGSRLLLIALIVLGMTGFGLALRVTGLLNQTLAALTGREFGPRGA